MGLISRLLFGTDIDWSSNSSNKDNKKEEEKKRLKNLGLDDEEIRLVMEDGWDETSFEEDQDMEVEDDDYYGEDDFFNSNDEDDDEDEDDEWV